MKSPRIKNLLAALALLFVCTFQSGCAICCGTYDEAYASHCGLWERHDLFHGRVGSPMSDPNARVPHSMPVENLDQAETEIIQ